MGVMIDGTWQVEEPNDFGADGRYVRAASTGGPADRGRPPSVSDRLDVAYQGALKYNLKRLIDYVNLWGYVRELSQWPGVAETVDLAVYKQGYYGRSALGNPVGIVPKGPAIDLTEPHGRERLSPRAA